MKRIQTTLLLLAIAIAIAFVGQRCQRLYHARQDRAEIKALKARWSGGEFQEIPLSAQSAFDLVRPAVMRASTNGAMNPEMLSALGGSMELMLRCFSSGDSDLYRSFHFPLDSEKHGQLNPGRMAIIKNAVRQAVDTSHAPLHLDASDEDTFISWGYYLAAKAPYRICTNCWRKVNFEDIRVTVSSFTRTNPPSLHKVARDFEPLQSTSVFESVVRYKPTPEEVMQSGRPVVYAFARIPVSMSKGDVGVYPVYASFYWADEHRKWIPDQIGLPSSESSIRLWF